MAEINPLRYRGYYYDTETGFYYLQSRYYDPVTHRFINADSITSTGQGFTGTNMFAYCLNNPVVYQDSSGTSGEIAIEWIKAIADSIDDAVAVAGQWAAVYAIVCVAAIATLGIGYGISCVIGEAETNEEEIPRSASDYVEPDLPDVTYPGNDPTIQPGEDYEWKGQQPVGGDKGAWVNSKTGEQWHPDLNHKLPKGPHWDYKDPDGIWWSVFENGEICPK